MPEAFKIKKRTKQENKTVRMPSDLVEKMERLAAKNDVSFNHLLVQCCEYALKNLQQEEQPTGRN